jgi:trans-aconitate methyltransferase
MACCCDFTDTVDRQFTSKKGGHELHRYRRKGARPTTRLLIDGISRAGVADGSLLDIGAGVGALTFELLERGFDRAVIVEAAGYTAAASSEAVRRAPQVEFVSGDFLKVARTVPAASVVALDRVVLLSAVRGMLTEAIRSRRAHIRLLLPERALVRPSRHDVGECTPITQTGFRTFVRPETKM